MVLPPFIDALFSRWRTRNFRSPEPGANPDHWLGRQGEDLAARHLRRNGYRVLHRNFRAPHGGEVDLVCRDKSCDTLVFVEVKTRRGHDYGEPGEAVTLEKQKLIARGALAWLALLGHPDVHFRFDIVEVLAEHDIPSLHIIKDAFRLPEPYIY